MPARRSSSTASRSQIDGPLSAKAHGIAIIYQELALSPNLTVAENIYLGREAHRGPAIDRAGMYAGCADILANLGATFGPRTLVGDLSIAEQQMVEVARAIHAHSRILVMDEPTTALSNRETRRLFDLIQRLQVRRPGDHLHLAPHGRGVRTGRARFGAARRRLCRHAEPRGDQAREHRAYDGRARSVVVLQEGASRRIDRQGGDGGARPSRRAPRQARQLRAARRRGAGSRRAGRRRTHRTRAPDLRRRAAYRRHGDAGGARGELRDAGCGDRRRHRLSDRGPQGAGPVPRHDLRRQHQSRRDRPRRQVRRMARPRARQVALAGRDQGAQHPRARARGAGRRAVWRQPAEGAAVAAAGDAAEGADPGRADARRRYRRQVGDLPHHRRARAGRRRRCW